MTTVRTITGPSIHEALREARKLLGDDVVLLESVPAEGGQPARITVMADQEGLKAVAAPAVEPPVRQGLGYGYGAPKAAASRAGAAEEPAAEAETFSSYFPVSGDGAVREENDVLIAPAAAPKRAAPPRPAPSPLFELVDEAPVAPPSNAFSAEQVQQVLDAQFRLVHQRLDAMERRFQSSVIGTGHRWLIHPLYTRLLASGMRPATANHLFDRLAEAGYTPEMDVDALRTPLADALRTMLSVPVPKMTSGATAFVGPTGAGKTSLILKLATTPAFYGRAKTAVIVVRPPEGKFYIDPLPIYHKHKIPAKAVSTPDEMKTVLEQTSQFDHLLIDTPPLPAEEAAAWTAMHRLQGILHCVMPLHVQFVFNVTRTFEHFNESFLRNLPLVPETIALTHLDETTRPGRLAEWVTVMGLPVQFISSGTGLADSLSAFSPSQFVETILEV